jgi:hypothetical protein
VDGLFGVFVSGEDDSVGKRLVQKKGLTLLQSHESVFSVRNVSVLRDTALRLSIAAAFSIRLILTFPSAPAPIATPAERSEKTSPVRMPVDTVLRFIAASIPLCTARHPDSRYTLFDYKARAKM